MAVYTHPSPAELEAFLAAYDLGALTALQGIQEGVENSNFRLITSQGQFILTVYEKRVDPADLPFFLGLMEHLAKAGVPCPLPIHGRDGRTLHALAGKPAAIVTFLEGRWPRRVTPGHCSSLGEALARLHEAGRDFTLSRANALAFDGWQALALACRGKAALVAPELEHEITAELERLALAWPRDLPQGVIHADLFPDNAFFEGERVTGVIDFYFACNDLLAYDLAICLNAWCFEADGAFNVTKARSLCEGYRRGRALSAAEIEALPILARGAALRFLTTRLYDWLHRVDGALVRPKDPREYLTKLRFHQRVDGPGAYGLT
jgi:homoserine kinase type II